MRIKSKDIAEALGISTATVSLVLNHKPGASPETRERVMNYINQEEQKLLTKQRAESVQNQGTLLMLHYIKHGLIMKRGTSEAYPHFYEQMAYMANRAGYQFAYEEFNETTMNMEDTFLRWKQNQVKGIYIMAAEMNHGDAYLFRKLDIPIVVGDNLFFDLGMDSFLIDNTEGIGRGVDYLVDKGHSNIVYLAENTNIFNFVERREAFVKEMERRECGDNSNRIRHLGNTVDEVYAHMSRYLDEGLRKTTALVLESSVVSMGVSKALFEYHIRVPKDISLLGFDALPDSSIPGLNLTLIKGTHTKRHMAAMKHLIRHLQEENEEEEMIRVYYRTRMIEGDSVFDKSKYIYIK